MQIQSSFVLCMAHEHVGPKLLQSVFSSFISSTVFKKYISAAVSPCHWMTMFVCFCVGVSVFALASLWGVKGSVVFCEYYLICGLIGRTIVLKDDHLGISLRWEAMQVDIFSKLLKPTGTGWNQTDTELWREDNEHSKNTLHKKHLPICTCNFKFCATVSFYG